jgi:hypothetical protein
LPESWAGSKYEEATARLSDETNQVDIKNAASATFFNSDYLSKNISWIEFP